MENMDETYMSMFKTMRTFQNKTPLDIEALIEAAGIPRFKSIGIQVGVVKTFSASTITNDKE